MDSFELPKEFDIFVPGRLCILGEHTDWTGQHIEQSNYLSKINDNLADYLKGDLSTNPNTTLSSHLSNKLCGYTIVCTTNEGIYIKCKVNNEFKGLIYKYKNYHSEEIHEVKLEYLDPCLHDIAKSDKYYSYVVGTLIAILNRYSDRIENGIEIYNYQSTLPVKKGLSSSAAICVSIIKSFNEVFYLNLSRDEIMDLAYIGEMNTLSQCGRMDQCVAMGKDSIALMSFYEDSCQLVTLNNSQTIYFVVADLNASKDTVVILHELNDCFPNPKSNTQLLMHEYVYDNVLIVNQAIQSIESGNILQLAECMKQSQDNFDKKVAVNCPSQLIAPRLHAIMSDHILKNISLAMKGVGSQGDGSIQILCNDSEMQKKVLIRLKELNCDGFPLTISPIKS